MDVFWKTLPKRLYQRECLASAKVYLRQHVYVDIHQSLSTQLIPLCRLCVTVGVLAIITSAFGFIGSHYKRFFLSAYVFLGTIVSTIQLILVLVMFVDGGGVVDRIEAYDVADGETWITR